MQTKIYEHRFDASRVFEAVKLTPGNAEDVAEWCGGQLVQSEPLALEVPVQAGDATVMATDDSYIVVDVDGAFHVRTARIFEAKYRLSDNQDDELSFDDNSGDQGDAEDRLQ